MRTSSRCYLMEWFCISTNRKSYKGRQEGRKGTEANATGCFHCHATYGVELLIFYVTERMCFQFTTGLKPPISWLCCWKTLPSQGIHLWGSLFWDIRRGRHFPHPHAVVPPGHDCGHMVMMVAMVAKRPRREICHSDENVSWGDFLLSTSTSYWFPFDFWWPVNLDPL